MPNIGPALTLSDKALEQVSQVSPVDIEAARALWETRVPSYWKKLLISQTVTPGAVITTPFAWDASSRRYIDMRTRRYIPFAEIRDRAIEPFILQSRATARAMGSQLQQGGKLAEWERAMLEEVKLSQVAASLAANGGVTSETEDDRDHTAEIIIILLLLLREFAYQLQTGKQALNGFLLLRSDLYTYSTRGTFEEVRRFGMGSYFGATEERRRLGVADHCEGDGEREGCIELHDLGWAPIGTLPRLGDTPCRSNCKCRFEYRYKDESGDWVMIKDSATVARILGELGIREESE